MPRHPNWTTKRITTVGSLFIEEWRKNPDLPLSKDSINLILEALGETLRVGTLSAPSTKALTEWIDATTLREDKKLAPTLGVRGRLFRRVPGGGGTYDPAVKPAPRAKLAKAATTSPRIKWEKDELMRIHLKLVPLYVANPCAGLTVAMVAKAMREALPENRWRKFATLSLVPEVVRAADEEIRGILDRGLHPKEVERPVEVPYDLGEVLEHAPLPRLAAALAERMTLAQLSFYASGGEARATPAGATREILAATGVDAEHIDVALPRVQVIGFRKTQHEAMLVRFAGKPVMFCPSIEPGEKADLTRLASNAFYLLDSTTAGRDWCELVIKSFPPNRREKVYGASRVLDRVKDIYGDFITKQGAAFNLWRQRQQQLRQPNPSPCPA